MARVSIRRHHNLGFGVFATHALPSGSTVLKFRGSLVDTSVLPTPYVEDYYTQVGRTLFMGPSGEADDYVNHSCNPNTGLRPNTLSLVALRDIAQNEEITWDYSTYIIDDDWFLTCQCGSTNCRKIVSDWHSIPVFVRRQYLAAGIVPDYVQDS